MRASALFLIILQSGDWATPGLFLSPARPESSTFTVPVGEEWLYLGEAIPGAQKLSEYEAGNYYYIFYGEKPPAGIRTVASFPGAHLLSSTEPLPGYPGGELLLLHPLPGVWQPQGPLTTAPPDPFGGGWIDPAVIALIDVEHYLDHLEELTAIPTRFSFSEGCTQAAELLTTTLGAWGYAPYYHTYSLNGAGTVAVWDISAIDENTAYGVGLMAVKTTDGGATWHAFEETGGFYVRSVHFLDTNTGWVGGYRTMLATTDGGETWEQVDHEFPSSIRDIDFVDAQRGCAVGWGFISWTDDGGEAWHKGKTETSQLLYSVSMADTEHGWAVGQLGTILRTNDGGRTWHVQPNLKQDEGSHLFGVHAIVVIGIGKQQRYDAEVDEIGLVDSLDGLGQDHPDAQVHRTQRGMLAAAPLAVTVARDDHTMQPSLFGGQSALGKRGRTPFVHAVEDGLGVLRHV